MARRAEIWYRKARGAFYVEIFGKQYVLAKGPDNRPTRVAAEQRFHALMAELLATRPIDSDAAEHRSNQSRNLYQTPFAPPASREAGLGAEPLRQKSEGNENRGERRSLAGTRKDAVFPTADTHGLSARERLSTVRAEDKRARYAVSVVKRFTVSLATPERRQSWPKDQSFIS